MLLLTQLHWSLVRILSISSHFLSDLHVDRDALDDERLEESVRDSFGFQLTDLSSEEGGRQSDIATVESSMIRGSGTDEEAETYLGEIHEDTPVSPPSASADIPSFATWNISFLHTAGTGEPPTSQLKLGETSVLPAVEDSSSSPVATSSSMLLEVCRQSSDQLMSLSVCAPVYAHPDVVRLEASSSERPVVLEREATRAVEEHRPPFGPQFPSECDYEEIVQPDGSVVRRRVISTSVRRVATRRRRRRQPDGRVVEFTETLELPGQEDVHGGDDQSLSDLTAAVPDTDVAGLGHVVGVHTDTAKSGQPHVDTDVEVVRETLPDGRVIERRIVRTRQRRTVVKRIVVRPDRP